MFTKEAYDIDLNILIPELDKIINYQTLNSNFKISKAEYLERLHYAADYFGTCFQQCPAKSHE